MQEFRADLVNVLAKAWMLGMLCFAWGVGISRWAPAAAAQRQGTRYRLGQRLPRCAGMRRVPIPLMPPALHTSALFFHLSCLRSIIDYQHDPSDVVGAALLGTMIALVGAPAGAVAGGTGGVTGGLRWAAVGQLSCRQ